jgi:hypothetical protein
MSNESIRQPVNRCATTSVVLPSLVWAFLPTRAPSGERLI